MGPKEVRRALVTGASRGIGNAIGLALAAEGVHTVFASRSASDSVDTTSRRNELKEYVSASTLDLSDLENIANFAAEFSDKFDRLDILINCAGIFRRDPIDRAALTDLDELYATNVRGTYALTQALLPMLIKQRGDIVFVNSSVTRSDGRFVGQYAATQHALRGIADSVRAEVNDQGVRVLSVYPGRTATPLQREIHDSESKKYVPNRLLQPGDVASIIVSCVNLPETAEVTDLYVRPRTKTEQT